MTHFWLSSYDFSTISIPLISETRLQYSDQYQMSPGQKYFAYTENFLDDNGNYSLYKTHVINAAGEEKYQSEILSAWGGIVEWISDEELLVADISKLDGTMWKIAIDSGQITEVKPNFPDVTWFDGSYILYDSTLTHVLYLRNRFEENETIALWDVIEKKTLWERPIEHYYIIDWSSDENKFSTVLSDSPTEFAGKLAIIDYQGNEINDITNDAVGYQSWSPSGRYIAYWTDFQLENGGLSVWDSKTLSHIDYCIRGQPVVQSPIWSKDDRYIAINVTTSDENTNVVVVDTIENHAYTVAENVRVKGWLY